MIDRRDFCTGMTAATLAAGLASVSALAETPKIPQLRIVAPGSAGGGFDETARVSGEVLQATGLIGGARITNIAGAGGTVGLVKFIEEFRGREDGWLVSGSTMVSAIIANKTPVSLSDTTPLARLFGTFNAIVVADASPHKTIGDLVKAFMANPGAVSWAGGSIGGGDHLIAGMVAAATGVDPRRVNYVPFAGGGEVLAALLGGHVAAASSSWSEVSEQVRAGKLRCLALTSDKAEAGADAPTLRSQGIDVTFHTWRALLAAPGLDAAQRGKALAMVEAMVKSAAWKAAAEKRGWSDFYLAGDAFKAFIDEEAARYRTTLASLGLA